MLPELALDGEQAEEIQKVEAATQEAMAMGIGLVEG